jgi:rhamnosyltransferase
MILKDKNPKRLIIYFFYDADGLVDRYVPYMLNALKTYSSEIFVVCNGKLTDAGRNILSEITHKVLMRENKGFDVWAYKAAIDSYGWDELVKFDEVIFMNHTIMGPVFPFSEMFGKMDSEDVDFWGITKFHQVMLNPFNVEYGYIPEHIQSHWIAVRSNMLKSPLFKSYWDERPEIKDYSDAIGKHEAIFTKYFSDKGFSWKVYADFEGAEKFTDNPVINSPIKMFELCRCPIFKRRSFFQEHECLLSQSYGEQAKEIIQYLKKNTDYDVSLIFENILRTCNLFDIKRTLNLNYVLPDSIGIANQKKKKIALVMHLYFIDLVDYCYQYALSLPDYTDIYITTNSEDKKQVIMAKFSANKWNSVQVDVVENRGRGEAALLVCEGERLLKYDLVCVVHDKKVGQLDYGIKGFHFSERCFKNLLGTKELVEQIIQLFDSNEQLGLICPPPPYHADYSFSLIGKNLWGDNFNNVQSLLKSLNVGVNLMPSKSPVAPIGGMFWFRPCGMKKLLEYGWSYTDFPEEPLETDGTILHAIERMYSYVEQDAGYYTAYMLSSECARTELTNLYYLNELSVESCLRQEIKCLIRRFIPSFVWLLGKKLYYRIKGIVSKI